MNANVHSFAFLRRCTNLSVLGFGLLAALFSYSVYAAYDTDSLEGYWKLDEGSGTSAADSSGHNRTGTLTNTPTWTVPSSPTIGFTNLYDLSFSLSSSEYVSIDSAPSGGFPFTYSAWINTSNSSDAIRTIVSEGSNGASNPTFSVRMVNDGDATCTLDDSLKVFLRDDAGTTAQLCSGAAYNDGSWHHIVVVSSAANNHALYVDGSSVDTDTTSLSTVTLNRAAIGALIQNGIYQQYFDGQIDDVRIYSRALSSSEISALAAGSHTTAIWDGSSSTDFETAANWDISAVPDPFTHLMIDKVTNDPVLSASVSGASLTIYNGADLDLHGFHYESTDGGTFSGSGTLKLIGSETLESFNNTGTGTVLYYGTGSYTGLAAGDAYHNLHINDGLIGYYKLDDGSGTRILDSSGHDNNGVLTNSDSDEWSANPTNNLSFTNLYSLDFDGTNDYVTLGDVTFLDGLSAFSIAAWYKVPNTTGQYVIAAKWVDSSIGNARVFLIDVNAGNLRAFGPATSSISTTVSTTANVWHHVAFVKTATQQILYHDGMAVGSTANTNSVTNNTEPFLIGAKTDSDVVSAYMTGEIDDVRVYDRLLQPYEVAALATGHQPATASGAFTLDANLAIANDLILSAGDVDASGSNYTVTLSGSWLNYGGQFSPQSGTVIFDGASGTKTLQSGGQAFANVTKNAASTIELADILDVNGTVTLSAGTIDVTTGNYSVHAHDFDQSGGTFTPRSGLVSLDGSSDATWTITSTLNELQIEDPTENGLVGYWKFDECQGDTAVDLSGNGNNGTLSGPPLWTGSSLASGIQFDNPCALSFSGSYVNAGSDASLDITGDITMSGWVRFSNAPPASASEYTVIEKGDGTDNYKLRIDENQYLEMTLDTGTQATCTDTTTTIPTNTWTHVTGVYDGSNQSLFVNGALVKQCSDSGSIDQSASDSLLIGANEVSGGKDRLMFGLIDDVRLYNRALSAGEVENLGSGYYADGDNSTATFTTGGNLDVGTGTILSGKLAASSRTIDVSNDWENFGGTGSFVAGTSTVDLDGSVTQNVRGSTNFHNFEVSTTSAQTVKFGSGTTQGVSNLITLTGQSSNVLTLSPLVASTTWFLNVDSSATQSISYVSPSFSNALSGAAIAASDGTSTDGGNNINWQFTPVTVSFQSGSTTLGETDGTATVQINLSGSTLVNITIPYTVGGTATENTDYTITHPSPVYINAGETSTGITISLTDDSIGENDETIIFTIGSPTNASAGSTESITITLTSDEAPATSSDTSASTTSGGGRGSGGPGGRGILAEAARLALLARFKEAISHTVAATPLPQHAAAIQPSDEERTHFRAERRAQKNKSFLTPSIATIAERRGLLMATVQSQEVLYADVPIEAWFTPFVAALIQEEIVMGYADEDGNPKGEFGVQNPVTYAEVLKMAFKASDESLHTTAPPRNTSAKNSWASAYVSAAEAQTIALITPDLNVHTPATRAETVRMIMDILDMPIATHPAEFVDVPADHPHSRAIATAAYFGIVEGDVDADGTPLNTFRPDDEINRAEVAKIIALVRELRK